MPARPKIGAQIRRARQLLDMRQQDLADKLGVSRNTVDSWENDRAYPQRTLARLEQVLEIDLTQRSAPGPVPGLVAGDEWERSVLSDPDLDEDVKRELIVASRGARAAYAARRAGRPAGRQAG